MQELPPSAAAQRTVVPRLGRRTARLVGRPLQGSGPIQDLEEKEHDGCTPKGEFLWININEFHLESSPALK